MLARLGEPFDSDLHWCEVKWDGMRTLAYVADGGLRLVNRHRHDVTARFPELAFLADLEAGAVLDGELIALRGDKPDFGAIMGRRHARGTARIAALARGSPATYVAFDLLYRRFEPQLALPLQQRRALLAEVVRGVDPRLVLSDGVVGKGKALFEQVRRQGLEGIVQKRLDSPYRPGQRTDAWIKAKCTQTAVCAILGFEPNGARDFKSLVIAVDDGGQLRCVGQVGSGIGDAVRRRLNDWMRGHPRPQPLVPCDVRGSWIEPGLYCTVEFLERTPNGNLRAPVFVELLDER